MAIWSLGRQMGEETVVYMHVQGLGADGDRGADPFGGPEFRHVHDAATKMPMIAMTTSNSTSVKPRREEECMTDSVKIE